MVQMGDGVAVERCVQNLNNVNVGLTGAAPLTHNSTTTNDDRNNATEHKLQLAFSKQPYLSEVTNPYPLPDKSPSYKEYITNKNNRFMNPAMASKNRIQPPSKVHTKSYKTYTYMHVPSNSLHYISSITIKEKIMPKLFCSFAGISYNRYFRLPNFV